MSSRGILIALSLPLIISAGCTSDPSGSGRRPQLPLRVSEVLRVNGHLVGLTQYEGIHSRWPRLSAEQRLWAATAAVTLYTRRKELAPWTQPTDSEADCLHLAIFALGGFEPAEETNLLRQLKSRIGSEPERATLRARIDAEIAKSDVEKNTEVLKEIQ